MKTADEVLKKAYNEIERLQDDSPEVLDPLLISMMDEYADQFKPKWISVEEQLPVKEGPYLVYMGGNNVSSFHISTVWFYLKSGFYAYSPVMDKLDVTHWMSLPVKPHGKLEL